MTGGCGALAAGGADGGENLLILKMGGDVAAGTTPADGLFPVGRTVNSSPVLEVYCCSDTDLRGGS